MGHFIYWGVIMNIWFLLFLTTINNGENVFDDIDMLTVQMYVT